MSKAKRVRPSPDPYLGLCIRKIRKDARETQERFAASIGVSNSTLSRIERGEEWAAPDLLVVIAERAGITVSSLLAKAERAARAAA